MRYTVRHITRFAYETPISESVMEVRMQPRSEGRQRCLSFSLSTVPASRVLMYQGHDGNMVHHFDVPGRHSRLALTAHAVVESAPPVIDPEQITSGSWETLDGLVQSGEFWDLLAASQFAEPTDRLFEFARAIGLMRGPDPLATLRVLLREIYERFEYSPQSTRVDSPIDEALRSRRGVCQDFSHIFIALARQLGIPTRYVSGYLFRDVAGTDRSTDGATHAWVEAFVPEIGWVGLDPTNNVFAGDRHIRVAVGRDYADVPPTRGVYKGISAVRSELAVAVRINSLQPTPYAADTMPFTPWMSWEAGAPMPDSEGEQQQQQQ
jgi:transglutaminase-like putative cysteine protease